VVEEFVETERAEEAAAELVVTAVERAFGKHGRARLAITGGSAAAALRHVVRSLGAAWSQVVLTWIDERCVPLADPQSNRGQAYALGYLPKEPRPLHELALYLDGEKPQQAAARVEHDLRKHFDSKLDVVFYGLGEDGHIASLFPGHPALEATGLATAVTDSPKPPKERVTLTLRALASSSSSVLLACGRAKRGALERLRDGDPTQPGSRLPNLVVVTDLRMGAKHG
jgi:6-phosphogluconolactonase